MELLLMIIFIAVFGLWMRFSDPKTKPKVNWEPCDLHNWTYNTKDQLQCSRCNYVAGTGGPEDDAQI